MRIDAKKYLFVGLSEEKESFFAEAQKIGMVEFIQTQSVPALEMSPLVRRISESMKVVRTLPVASQLEFDDIAIAEEITQDILSVKAKQEKLIEEERLLHHEIPRVRAFGDFDLDDIAYIEQEGGRRVQFFTGERSIVEHMAEVDGVLFLGFNQEMAYFLSIQKQLSHWEGMVEVRIDRSLSNLEKRLKHVQEEISLLEHRLKGYAKYYDLLKEALIAKLNTHHVMEARATVRPLMEEQLFVVEAWVPSNKGEELDRLVKDHMVHAEEIAVEEADRVPTCLDNVGAARLGQDLCAIYDAPSSTDRDPSLWVLTAFSLFFAMIIGDGGYGALFLAFSLYLMYKFRHLKGLGKRTIRLCAIVSCACIFWGVLTNSYFSMTLSFDSPLRKVSLFNWMAEKRASYHLARHDSVFQAWTAKFPQAKAATTGREFLSQACAAEQGAVSYPVLDQFYNDLFLEVSLFIGVIHLILSFLRYADRNPTAWGWVAFLVGAYLYFPYYLQATSLIHYAFGVPVIKGAQVGLHLMFGGIGLSMLMALFHRKWSGILEITTVMQVSSDVLSYLRLYALGMSGSILASVINHAASSVPLLVGAIIVVCSHGINIALGLMSGVIHGLRLNFIEWYHWSFEGGGKLFQPLRLIEPK